MQRVLLDSLSGLSAVAATVAAPSADGSSGHPVWPYVLRGLVVLGLLFGAWNSWRSRKRP